MKIAGDRDVMTFPANKAVEVMVEVFRERTAGSFVSPPRMSMDSDDGKLVFTPGGSLSRHIMGFRVYNTFGDGDQITMVYDSKSGKLKGSVMGDYIGALRTGSIGAVSTRYMSNPDAAVLGIIGTGKQAFTQAITSATVRDFKEIHVYSPSMDHRKSFAVKVENATGITTVPEESSTTVAEMADVLILATTSNVPVIRAGDIGPGTHIISVGRKTVSEHELDLDVVDLVSVVATDSMTQINSYHPPHFMSGSKNGKNMVELADIVSGKTPGRIDRDDITLFLSVGLSGTEVALADMIIDSLEAGQP